MKDDKQYTEGISVKENKFLVWLDNYWYHYKWVTIVVAFFLIVAAICIIQSCTKESTDILITYAGPVALKSDEKVNIEKVLSSSLPKTDDGVTTSVGLSSYYILSKDQIESVEKQTDEEGYKYYVDRSFVTSEQDNFESQLMTGSGSVLLIDRWIYDSFVGSTGKTERLVPLSEVLEATPEGAVGAYGIRLGDTELYKNNPQIQALPADTVICLHAQILGQKNYDKEIEAFKALTRIADGE